MFRGGRLWLGFAAGLALLLALASAVHPAFSRQLAVHAASRDPGQMAQTDFTSMPSLSAPPAEIDHLFNRLDQSQAVDVYGLAVLLLGERPSVLQWVAIPVVTIGAVLTTLTLDRQWQRPRLVGLGPILAVFAAFAGSVPNVGLKTPIREVGPVQAIVVQRVFTVLIVVGVVTIGPTLLGGTKFLHLIRQPREGSEPIWQLTSLVSSPILIVLGAIDAVGFLAFTFALSITPAWIVGLISQSGRMGATFVAFVIFGEKMAQHQWLGVGLLALGIALSAGA